MVTPARDYFTQINVTQVLFVEKKYGKAIQTVESNSIDVVKELTREKVNEKDVIGQDPKRNYEKDDLTYVEAFCRTICLMWFLRFIK